MTAAIKPVDPRDAFQRIQDEATKIAVATATAEAILASIKHVLIGCRFEPIKLGRLKGVYQIAYVELHYQGEVHAHGRKVLASGKLGSQMWDLGQIDPRRLGL